MIRAGRVNATLQFVETKRNFGSLSVAFTFSLQHFLIFLIFLLTIIFSTGIIYEQTAMDP